MNKLQNIKLNKKQKICIIAAVIVLLCAVAAAIAAAQLSGREETQEITEPVSVIVDEDDADNSVIEDTEKGNLIELKDENGNTLTLIPVYDVSGSTVICGYVKSARDASGAEITDENIINRMVAVTTDVNGVYSITLKDGKTQFVDYYTNENNEIIAVQSAADGKYYEVVTETGESGNIYMHLKADEKGLPVEVEIKSVDGKNSVVEKGTNKVVSQNAGKDTAIKQPSVSSSGTPDNENQSTDNTIGFVNYDELADINVVLTKNSTAAVGLDPASPVKAEAKSKAYVDNGVLYLNGNGDYYITSDVKTWYGRIVVSLGNQGLARVRLAGVNIVSSASKAIEFIDTDTVINDKDTDGEVLIYKNTASTKNNPDAVLSFVDGTYNSLSATGNENSGGSGTVYSECKLSIKGHGSAEITSKNKNAIHTERSLGIQNCTLTLSAIAGKGIRTKGTLDIEEAATITIRSTGDAIRCNEFIMDTDVKDANGNKDRTTGSTVNLYPSSGSASPTTGDGIDADDAVIIRAGKLNIEVVSDKEKYGIKVRRVNNEEFLNVIKSEGITDIEAFKANNQDSPYYADVVLNEKEYISLMAFKDKSNTSADYQGIRNITGCDDTFRITGGTVKVKVGYGRNTTILPSTNNQGAISAYASLGRTISIDNFYSSGDDMIRAMIYSGSNIDPSASYSVVFGTAGKRNPEISKKVEFSNKIAYVTDAA